MGPRRRSAARRTGREEKDNAHPATGGESVAGVLSQADNLPKPAGQAAPVSAPRVCIAVAIAYCLWPAKQEAAPTHRGLEENINA